jgi:hypothetical protein
MCVIWSFSFHAVRLGKMVAQALACESAINRSQPIETRHSDGSVRFAVVGISQTDQRGGPVVLLTRSHTLI